MEGEFWLREQLHQINTVLRNSWQKLSILFLLLKNCFLYSKNTILASYNFSSDHGNMIWHRVIGRPIEDNQWLVSNKFNIIFLWFINSWTKENVLIIWILCPKDFRCYWWKLALDFLMVYQRWNTTNRNHQSFYDLLIKRGSLLLKDYLCSKFDVCQAKKSWDTV